MCSRPRKSFWIAVTLSDGSSAPTPDVVGLLRLGSGVMELRIRVHKRLIAEFRCEPISGQPRVGGREYHGRMVDQALLEQVMRLDESTRRELRDAIDDSLDDGYVSPEIAAIIDQRIAEADANPDDFVTLDEFEREVRARRSA